MESFYILIKRTKNGQHVIRDKNGEIRQYKGNIDSTRNQAIWVAREIDSTSVQIFRNVWFWADNGTRRYKDPALIGTVRRKGNGFSWTDKDRKQYDLKTDGTLGKEIVKVNDAGIPDMKIKRFF